MSGLSASQLLFYGGIGVMALAVLAAACWIGVPLEQAAAIVSRPLE